ncbi:hypothetical protein ACRRVB_03380 [Candidatus Cardinium hertigii]|uniref:hypothetical protein n=1 Tax=Candidatus Cardinium hertigii TaxID=247481 RepID=UPI003D7F01E5
MGGCSSIKHGMKVRVPRHNSKPTKVHPYNLNSTSNYGSRYADEVLSRIEEETKKVLDRHIETYLHHTKKYPKYFQGFINKLNNSESMLDSYTDYIQLYEFLNNLKSEVFVKKLIPSLENLSLIKKLKENVSLLYQKIKEVKNDIKNQSEEFHTLSENISMYKERISKKVKEACSEDLKKITSKINIIRLIEEKNACGDSKSKSKSKYKKEINYRYKSTSALIAKITTKIETLRASIIDTAINTAYDESIEKTSAIEEVIKKKVDTIDEGIESISNEYKEVIDSMLKLNLSAKDMASNVASQKQLSKLFCVALKCNCLIVAYELMNNSLWSEKTINQNILCNLSNNILQDQQNNQEYNLKVDWTIFRRLLYRNKININMQFDSDELKSKVTMLDLFLENNDIDSASNLIAYSTVNFNKNTYLDLIKLLSNSTSHSLVALFQRLMQANNYFNEDDTKHINKFLYYIEKNEKCVCNIKKFSNRSVSACSIHLPDTPPPSPPSASTRPSTPVKPNRNCVHCTYSHVFKHSANHHIDSNKPLSRGKCIISNDGS